jgi:hypothetical protein
MGGESHPRSTAGGDHANADLGHHASSVNRTAKGDLRQVLFEEPILLALLPVPSAHKSAVFESIKPMLPIIPFDEQPNSVGVPSWQARASWCATALKCKGLLSKQWGVWSLTDQGRPWQRHWQRRRR